MTLLCVQTQLRYAGDDRQRNSLSEIGLMTKGETMEVNGIAHIFLTASNFERSREFYRQLLPFLGLKPWSTATSSQASDDINVEVAAVRRRQRNWISRPGS
jgi:hypothetical protein